MSNHPSNKEQGVKIELTPEQQNPGLAKPTDFEVTETDDPLPPTPGHGQRGETAAEYKRLLKERRGGESQPIPDRNSVEDAEEPNTFKKTREISEG